MCSIGLGSSQLGWNSQVRRLQLTVPLAALDDLRSTRHDLSKQTRVSSDTSKLRQIKRRCSRMPQHTNSYTHA